MKLDAMIPRPCVYNGASQNFLWVVSPTLAPTSGSGACPTTARIESRPDCVGFLTPAQAAALDPRGIGVNANLLGFINSRYPLPNDLSGGNGLNTALYRFNAPNTRKDDIYTGRIDIVPTETQRLFFRATITRRDSTNALQQFPGDADAVSFSDESFSFVGNHNWVINANATNSFTAGLVKQVNLFTPAPADSFPNSFSFGPITAPRLISIRSKRFVPRSGRRNI